MKKVYSLFLVSSFIFGTLFLISIHENIFGILGFSISLVLSYFLYENNKLLSGVFGAILSALYIVLYFQLKIYAQFNYEIYSFVMFISLIFRNNKKQNEMFLWIELIFSVCLGSLIYVIFSQNQPNVLIKILDICSYLLILVATLFTSRQDIKQFYFYIPSSLIIIIIAMIVKDYAILLTSFCFIIADIMSLFNWKKNNY